MQTSPASDPYPSDEPVYRWVRSIVRGIPRDYTAKTYMRRMVDHVVVYSAILAASVFSVFFLALPIETGVVILVLTCVIAVVVETKYRRQVKWPQRLAHLLGFALVGSFVLVAGFLTKLAQHLL
jgi:urea transporter